MIITCVNCAKNFELDSDDIPERGRLLKCGGCQHTWFFKKEISNEPRLGEVESPNIIGIINNQIENNFDKNTHILKKDKENYKILSPIIIFIISFIALIIVIDTFQKPISKIIPNIEFLLYNLYESINDIFLFLKNLI